MATLLPPSSSDGSQDRGPELLAVFWTECAVALAVMFLRVYARLMIKNVGLDDWVMFLTMALMVALCGLTTRLVLDGGARHLYDLRPTQIAAVVKFNWLTQPFGIMALAFGKISVALLLLRLMGPNARWRKWFLHISIILTFLVNTIGCILTYTQCNPPRALWEKVPGSKCWNPRVQSDYSVFSGCWNAFIDLALALLPITIVWNLKLQIKKKIGLCILLGLGVLASVCAAIKTSHLPSLLTRSDLTWATFDLYVWTASEIFLLIICGSIPTLKPLYDQIRGRRIYASFSPKGKRLTYPSKGSYQAYSYRKSASARFGDTTDHSTTLSTKITSSPNPALWSDASSVAPMVRSDIKVHQTFKLEVKEQDLREPKSNAIAGRDMT